MKNLLALIGLLVVGFGGLGWYFGWYDFSIKAGSDGRVNISGDVDVKKIKTDAGDFTSKLSQAIRNANQPPPHPEGLMGPPMPPDDNAPTTSSNGVKLGEIKMPAPSR